MPPPKPTSDKEGEILTFIAFAFPPSMTFPPSIDTCDFGLQLHVDLAYFLNFPHEKIDSFFSLKVFTLLWKQKQPTDHVA